MNTKAKIISKTDKETKFEIDGKQYVIKIEEDKFGPCAVLYDDNGKFVNKKWISSNNVKKEMNDFIKYMEWKYKNL